MFSKLVNPDISRIQKRGPQRHKKGVKNTAGAPPPPLGEVKK
jgi:hypothetical protein